MKPAPKGWPRLSASAYYLDAQKAVDWLCKAFGFEVRLKVEGEGGLIEHCELVCGDTVIMVGDERRQSAKGRTFFVSPKSVGGKNTQGMMLYVDDAAAHCARARAAGGEITYEPTVSDYGEDYWADKSYQCVDLEGHAWWFCERVRG
ncbi:MAG: VOC family protein [Archangium sp.]|nr:VOC family protein [Archangium sp.]